MVVKDLGELMPETAPPAPHTHAQPTTPPEPQTAQNGALGAPQSTLPLELCPELTRLLAAGLEQQQGALLLGLLAQCGREVQGVRWRLVLGSVTLEPEG